MCAGTLLRVWMCENQRETSAVFLCFYFIYGYERFTCLSVSGPRLCRALKCQKRVLTLLEPELKVLGSKLRSSVMAINALDRGVFFQLLHLISWRYGHSALETTVV